MNIDAVPSFLTATLRANKVKVCELNNEVRITPIAESLYTDKFLAIKHAATDVEDKMRCLYDLCGSGSDLEMTVDSFLAMTHSEKDLGDYSSCTLL
jgi:hypothetical protein